MALAAYNIGINHLSDARGYEAVLFVNRIRTYYETLQKKDEQAPGKKKSQALKFKAPAM
jgi:membrane-bound lytic murein transglycosylase MltF